MSSLEQSIRNMLCEQSEIKQAWEKEIKPKIDIGGSEHDPNGPNKSHIEEEQLNEVPINVAIGDNRRDRKRTSFPSTSLGGLGQKNRAGAQKNGNQKGRNRYGNMSEARERAMKKLSEKKSEKSLGEPMTKNKKFDTVNFEPVKPELTGFQ